MKTSMLLRVMLRLLVSGDTEQALLGVIDYLSKENQVLRAKFEDTGRRLLLSDEQRRELAMLARPVIRNGFRDIIQIFSPETLMRWWRRLQADKFDSSRTDRRPGRPLTPGWVCREILRMARGNRDWGCARIAGQISNLFFDVNEETVRQLLRKHNLEPAPERESQGTWHEFISRHRHAMWATDFFTAEVLTFGGLVTYYVCFFIHLQSRQVVIGGITPNPNAVFMRQVARNLTEFELENARFIIHDGDSKYKPFLAMLPDRIKPVPLPPRSPNLNAYAERFVRSIKEECLSKFIPLGERFLHHIIREYLAHYHAERNHQGEDIGNALLFPDDRVTNANPNGAITKHSRLGGLLNFYHRKSAAPPEPDRRSNTAA